MNISIPLFSLARDFAHLARPQVRDEHRRTVVRRASSTGREHSQGAKLPLKTGGVLADTSSTWRQTNQRRNHPKEPLQNLDFAAKLTPN